MTRKINFFDWFFWLKLNNLGQPIGMQRRRNAFQSGRAMEYWKVLSNTMVDRQGKFFNSRCSRMAKTVTFWPWWQPSNCFCFETLSFFSLFSHFSYCYAKKVEGPWPISSPPSLGVAGLGMALKFYTSVVKVLKLKLWIFCGSIESTSAKYLNLPFQEFAHSH